MDGSKAEDMGRRHKRSNAKKDELKDVTKKLDTIEETIEQQVKLGTEEIEEPEVTIIGDVDLTVDSDSESNENKVRTKAEMKEPVDVKKDDEESSASDTDDQPLKIDVEHLRNELNKKMNDEMLILGKKVYAMLADKTFLLRDAMDEALDVHIPKDRRMKKKDNQSKQPEQREIKTVKDADPVASVDDFLIEVKKAPKKNCDGEGNVLNQTDIDNIDKIEVVKEEEPIQQEKKDEPIENKFPFVAGYSKTGSPQFLFPSGDDFKMQLRFSEDISKLTWERHSLEREVEKLKQERKEEEKNRDRLQKEMDEEFILRREAQESELRKLQAECWKLEEEREKLKSLKREEERRRNREASMQKTHELQEQLQLERHQYEEKLNTENRPGWKKPPSKGFTVSDEPLRFRDGERSERRERREDDREDPRTQRTPPKQYSSEDRGMGHASTSHEQFTVPKFHYIGTKMTDKVDYGLWKKRIRQTIISKGAGWTIGAGCEGVPTTLIQREQVKAAVAECITRYLDDYHFRLIPEVVLNQPDPNLILQHLDKQLEPKSRIMMFQYHDQLGRLNFSWKTDTVTSYQTKFKELEEKMRLCGNVTDEELQLALVRSIKETCPFIYQRAVHAERRLTIDEVFAIMREEELSREDDKRREKLPQTKDDRRKRDDDRAMMANEDAICFKCGQKGHIQTDCKTDQILCYACNRYGDHIASNCPNPHYAYKKRDKSRGRRPERAERRGRDGRSDSWDRSRSPKREGGRSRFDHERSRGRRDRSRSKSPTKYAPTLKIISKNDAKRRNRERKRAGKPEFAMNADYRTMNYSPERQMVWVDQKLYDEELGADTDKANFTEDRALATYDGKSRNRVNQIYVIVDSGTSKHICKVKDAFIKLRKLKEVKRIACANGDESADLIIKYEGDIMIKNKGKLGLLRNVLYAPNLNENLFSISKIVETMNVTFTKRGVYLTDIDTNEVVKEGEFKGTFWELNFELPLEGVDEAEREKLIKEVYDSQKIGGSKRKTLALITKDDKEQNIEIGGSKKKRVKFNEKVQIKNFNPKEYEMKEDDLKRIEENRVKTLKEDAGLLWHMRLNHASLPYLKMAAKVIPELKGITFPKDVLECTDCIEAKARRKPCKGTRREVKDVFQRVHTDLIGQISPKGFRSKNQYIGTFTDEVSRYAFSYPLENKKSVHIILDECLKDGRRLKGDTKLKINILKSDGGGEFDTNKMKELMKREKIEKEESLPNTHQHNGKAERINLEIEKKVRVCLLSAKMPAGYWPYALQHTINIYNRTPHSALNFITPFEAFTGVPPKVKFVRRFGCLAYVLDENIPRGEKFRSRCKMGFLLCCNEDSYTILLKDDRRIIKTKNVDFVESRVYGDFKEMKDGSTELIDFGTNSTEMCPCEMCQKIESVASEKSTAEEEVKDSSEEIKEKGESEKSTDIEIDKLKEVNESNSSPNNDAWIEVVDDPESVESTKIQISDGEEIDLAMYVENTPLNDEPPIFLNGDPIIWRTKRQNHVALSSSEAEYVAMSLACRDVIAVNEMLRRITKVKLIPVIKEDSRPARDLAMTEESKTLKHIVKLCYHFIRELCRDKRVKIEWVSTTQQLGDLFTKPLDPTKFKDFRDKIMEDVE